MKLNVPFSKSVTSKNCIKELSLQADGLAKNQIGITPWPAYTYKPDVSFAILHGDDCILLKYFVTEKKIRAVYSEVNEPVYKDTCVEFFISFGNEKEYYNFEFNCLGNCLLGYGKNREDRKLLRKEIIKKINTQTVITSFDKSSIESISWELTLMIPFEVFCFHAFTSLKNQDCKVNFYKCGDDLPERHYVVWNNIKAEKPDFHLSEYFGEMKFIGV